MRISRLTFLVTLLLGVMAAWLVLLIVERSYREGPNYTCIEPGLWMGGFVREPPRGTQAVLNLCEVEDPYQREIHVWEPIRDAPPAPSQDWLRKMVDFIRTQRDNDRQTFVHCAQGVSRSGLVVTAFLMEKYGWTRDEALISIRSKRPNVRPHPAFMPLLAEWELAYADERDRGSEDSAEPK